jgi:hypothetical protein
MGAILVLMGIVIAEILPRWRRRTEQNRATATALATDQPSGE